MSFGFLLAVAASADLVEVPGGSVQDSESSGTAVASLSFQNDGVIETIGNVSEADGTWLLLGSAADYDIRLTVSSGDAPDTGPAVDTWLNLGTTRTWTLERAIAGQDTGSWLIEIRRTGLDPALDSGTYTMLAERTV